MKKWFLLFYVVICIRLSAQSQFFAEEIVYPENGFFHNNPAGRVYDITQPPFNADNTGIHDCTDILIAAMDTIVQRRKRVYFGVEATNNIIYLPNGTYKISNTIRHTPDLTDDYNNVVQIRFRGQSREKTIIRLQDRSPGFGGRSYKPVFSYGDYMFNNEVASNAFENITIDIGRGNSGAVGLIFQGANNATIKNITIRTEDDGKIGLFMPVGADQGYYKNILIEGFEVGIRLSGFWAKHVNFEYISLLNIEKNGIEVGDCGASFRKLYCEVEKRAIKLTHEKSFLVLTDSELKGKKSQHPAIHMLDGTLFARNVHADGFLGTISKCEIPVHTEAYIKEYISGPVYKLFKHNANRSLSLPIEDPPDVPWNDNLSDWACANDFGAVGDGKTENSKAVQKALYSGKPVVYFLPGLYLMDETVEVPASVERINFMYAQFKTGDSIKTIYNKPVFKINDDSDDPLVLEDLFCWFESEGLNLFFDHACTRTLIMSDLHMQRGRMYRNSVSGGKVFMENISNRTTQLGTAEHLAFEFIGQQVWIRFINSEYSNPGVKIDHSKVWVMGYKNEGYGTNFEILNHSEVEILGGFANSPGIRHSEERNPIIINKNSDFSAVIYTNIHGRREYFEYVMQETQNGEQKTLHHGVLPIVDDDAKYIPLIVGRRKTN